MKFTIITPTLLRDSLFETCESIETQSHKDWEHIVIVDGRDNVFDKLSMIKELRHSQRKFIVLSESDNSYGHTPRRIAWDTATGYYIMYLDDDDVYINDTMAKLNEFILEKNFPEWIVYPCSYKGKRLLPDKPEIGNITSIQHAHSKYDNKGKPIKWDAGKEYGDDGNWAIKMYEKYSMTRYEGEELVKVNYQSLGK